MNIPVHGIFLERPFNKNENKIDYSIFNSKEGGEGEVVR